MEVEGQIQQENHLRTVIPWRQYGLRHSKAVFGPGVMSSRVHWELADLK